MGPAELAHRLRDAGVKLAWRRRAGRNTRPPAGVAWACRLPPASALRLPPEVAAEIVVAGERLLRGEYEVFGRPAPARPGERDWFRDPLTGCRAPDADYAFAIDAADLARTGDSKHLMEPARLHQVTQLAAAWYVSQRPEFAEAAAAELRSFWTANPFLCGVHWTSGIEVGLRLVAMAWARRLLETWPGVADLFDNSPLATAQIEGHLRYVATLWSEGSSANNHLIAELLGLFVGSSAFPWFPQCRRWRAAAAARLEREAVAQTFPDGLNREQAGEYHGWMLELLSLAALEGRIAGAPFSPRYADVLRRMSDAWASVLDDAGRPPRSGDTDDGYVLLLGPADRARRPASLLAFTGALVGAAPFWPEPRIDLRSALASALAGTVEPRPAPRRRQDVFPDAGLVLLRDPEPRADAIWCRLDHGPHGYLSIMAHAHADALSLELRHGGLDILADPGTYCYRADEAGRRYFRSTLAHNTLEIAGLDQAKQAGTFLWAGEPRARLLELTGVDGDVACWHAEHDGYAHLPGAPVHERRVTLDRRARLLVVEDRIRGEGEFDIRLAFHLGPAVALGDDGALRWSAAGREWRGALALSPALEWRSHRGETEPLLGWYSPRFGHKEPSTTLVGSGRIAAGTVLRTELRIAAAAPVAALIMEEQDA
jgi:hypothetical protein